MEQEYDVKYAVAVVNKPGKVSFYPQGEDRLVGYIVSKVLVIREEEKYSKGVGYTVYDVLLPYVDISNRREEPIFSKEGNPVNTTRVYRLYDSYEEAAKERDELNKKLKFATVSKKIYNGCSSKNVENAFFDYNAQMKECNNIESVIKIRCEDLKTKSRVLTQ